MIKYLGSKRLLIPHIIACINALPDVKKVTDLFSGTSRVGHALKKHGYVVHSNDINKYAYTLARCYVEADASDLQRVALEALVHLSAVKPEPGYITENFCIKSRFFQPHNGQKIDAIREEIDRINLDDLTKAICLTSLIEAADRVDSTTGVQMAYLKQWAKRSFNNLELRLPDLTDRLHNPKSSASSQDATTMLHDLDSDCVYIDPPYNQHSYLGNYHIWETIVEWDKPELYGIAMKRIDCKNRKSVFNSKKTAQQAFFYMISNIKAPKLVISFSNEGFINRQEMEEMLRNRGDLVVIEIPYKRYIGAQIGIYSPSGNVVGSVSHTKNVEYIYVSSDTPIDKGRILPYLQGA